MILSKYIYRNKDGYNQLINIPISISGLLTSSLYTSVTGTIYGVVVSNLNLGCFSWLALSTIISKDQINMCAHTHIIMMKLNYKW